MLTSMVGIELTKAVEDLRLSIRSEMSPRGKRRFQFPGGATGEGENFEKHTSSGLLSIIVVSDQDHLNRYLHFINLDPPRDVVASDTEINIPKGTDRRISTLLAKDNERRYICNRGRITVHMRSLKKSVVLGYFSTEFNVVSQVNESGKTDDAILVAEIGSRSMFEDIALFTKRLKEFKLRYRNVYLSLQPERTKHLRVKHSMISIGIYQFLL
jgi:hypothetical protein